MPDFGVRAYHLILTHYGFWLPNDPRGSWSDFVRAWEIFLPADLPPKSTLADPSLTNHMTIKNEKQLKMLWCDRR